MRTPLALMMALAIAVGACSSGTVDPEPAIPEPTTTVAPTTTDPPTTTSVPSPTIASTGVRRGTLTVTGPQEVVFDWSTDRCDVSDIPDLPARAFRDADGDVTLLSSHTTVRRFVGPTLDQIALDCTPIFESTRNADPARWTDSEWLASVWTPDGTTVYGLLHNEYHGWERGDCTGGDPFGCWYNAITAVVSGDGGNNFDYLRDPPDHLVAAIPYRYTPDSAPVGMFSPSNIVVGPDEHWYALAKMGAHVTGRQSVCLMRTNDLSDPEAWRFWNGRSFDGIFVDPYTLDASAPQAASCPPLAIEDIGAQMIESLSWNTYLERWVLVGISADTIDGREVWGFYYSFSDDLVDWTRRRLLLEVPLPWTVDDSGNDLSYLYPSLLDPASESRNYETSGRTAYVYFTRHNAGQASLDRDLVRVPVEFDLESP